MREAADAVLKSTESGASRTWQNDASGNSGKVTALSAFNTEDHRECKRLRMESQTKKGGNGDTTMTVCRASGGPWKIDTDARPAPR